MNKPLVFTLILLTFALFVVNINLVFAHETENKIVFESVNPGNPVYSVKRVIEKIQEKFNNSSEFKYQLLEKRYKELLFLAKEKRESQMEQATSRYMTQLGTIIDTNSVLTDKSELMAEYVHNLEHSRDIYESNSAYWLFLQQSSELTSKLVQSKN